MDKELQYRINFLTKKVGKNTGFSTPEKYFEGIEDDIFTKLSEKKLPKKTPFEVPATYFLSLEDEILAKVTPKEKTFTKKETQMFSFRQRVRSIIPYASVASVVLFVSVYLFYSYNTTITIEDITVAEIEDWYTNGYGNINNTELTVNLESADFTNEELSSLHFTNDVLDSYFDTKDNTILLNEIQ